MGNWEQSGGKNVKLINEGGLYQVISSITKKDIDRYNYSREFKRWISNEVIPTLRNTGAYIEEEREEEAIKKIKEINDDKITVKTDNSETKNTQDEEDKTKQKADDGKWSTRKQLEWR